MVLSKRERIIAIVSIAAIALLVLDRYALTPLLDADSRVEEALDTARSKQEKDTKLVSIAAGTMSRKWKEMVAGGLKSDPAQSEGALLQALADWAGQAGFSLSSMTPERSAQGGELREITVHAAGAGSMAAVVHFLWCVEGSQMPLRIKNMTIGSRREGADDLSLQMDVSTLYLAPPSAKAPPAAAPPPEEVS